MEENLGSDHNIIRISIPLTTTENHKPRPTAITDWYKSRKEPSPTLNLDSPDEWAQEILAQTEKQTTNINTTPDIPYVDHHILSLWETRRVTPYASLRRGSRQRNLERSPLAEKRTHAQCTQLVERERERREYRAAVGEREGGELRVRSSSADYNADAAGHRPEQEMLRI
ncbi:hypothetical protein HPB47_011138 [Ixodes persulcatus]|uniref:Uncharacterized protein n=1 Tax=Ixodes persulcatus TaxID=34615 RepID=A0AC60NX63_IXOPE|nr:hypothetical protein HPB47_011138 [Ixodes persulcatus]